MHVPDGFLDARTAVAAGALAAAGLGIALRQARVHLPPRRVPLLGLAAAFVFAAQMINFPVLGGTSGHLLGAVLVAALLGPSAALVVMAAVLIVQCLMFADGGVSALGVNILTMGVVGGVVGGMIYRAVSRVVRGLLGRIVAAGLAAWCSTVLAAVACAGALAVSGTVAWTVVLPAMVGIHMVIGVGEGLITVLVLVAIARSRPELVTDQPRNASERSYGALLGYGFVIAVSLALLVSPWASSWPDGLDWVAGRLGFGGTAVPAILQAPMPDYKVPGLGTGVLATSLAGLVGTLVVLGLAWWLARVLVPRDAQAQTGQPDPVR